MAREVDPLVIKQAYAGLVGFVVEGAKINADPLFIQYACMSVGVARPLARWLASVIMTLETTGVYCRSTNSKLRVSTLSQASTTRYARLEQQHCTPRRTTHR